MDNSYRRVNSVRGFSGEYRGQYHGSRNSIPKDCATSGYKRVIHDASTWRFLQDTYLETVNNVFSMRYRNRRAEHSSYSGSMVDVEVKDLGKRGRSIYAMEPITKGTKIWSAVHLVRFYTPQELRSFLEMLDHDLQCDVLLWAYVEGDSGWAALALDQSSFFNHGETKEVINLGANDFTLWDIQVGEELLENYTSFIGFNDETTLNWFHQIRGVAWNEDGPSSLARSTNEYNLVGAPKVWEAARKAMISSHQIWQLGCLVIIIMVLSSLRRLLPPNSFRKQKDGL